MGWLQASPLVFLEAFYFFFPIKKGIEMILFHEKKKHLNQMKKFLFIDIFWCLLKLLVFSKKKPVLLPALKISLKPNNWRQAGVFFTKNPPKILTKNSLVLIRILFFSFLKELLKQIREQKSIWYF